jgi:hypothetical protein
MLHHPEYFQDATINPSLYELRALSKAQFFSEALPLAQASGAQ